MVRRSRIDVQERRTTIRFGGEPIVPKKNAAIALRQCGVAKEVNPHAHSIIDVVSCLVPSLSPPQLATWAVVTPSTRAKWPSSSTRAATSGPNVTSVAQ
jgi:hypothetical protein